MAALTWTINLKLEDGSVVAWDELTEEQRQDWREKSAERSRKYLNEYYANHPEEYEKLPDKRRKA